MVSEHWWENTIVQCTCNIRKELICHVISGEIGSVCAKCTFYLYRAKTTQDSSASREQTLANCSDRSTITHSHEAAASATRQIHALACQVLFDLSRLVTWRSPSCQNQNNPLWLISDHPNLNMSTPVSFFGEFSDISVTVVFSSNHSEKMFLIGTRLSLELSSLFSGDFLANLYQSATFQKLSS